MQVIKVKTRVDAEGKVILQVPQDLANQELEIAIVYQLVSPETSTQTPEKLGWISGFFEQTAGCLADEPLVRYPQGEYEVREKIE
ncbi:conserved hypothetical protein [Planktothrix serta PCC 8927]|uniref:Uncharacterized protein n=1 Tax=Planktothrix serta PCC 8927 TaxID=671068 RepID=A0A7Z9BP91_9CYAN|nr:hypothetical protein [Planktothrix serta]VXD18982.1 conserved hypothetical protein [Planktothrix serta PCC 8927]